MKTIPKKVIINVLLFVLAIFFTISTTFGGVKVFKKSDLDAISCGWPLSFITQNQNWRDPPYPWTVPRFASPLESPTKFYWERFVVDIVFFYLLILISYYGGNIIVKRMQRKKQDQNES
ncbi:MAG: hypothetical protein KAS04_05690 [Candidatus Aenigmarchaeota archaeon]|nr:hypothetical protein [Candidatus Aenigmarchaeota archaeon]